AELRFDAEVTELAVLALGGADEIAHGDRPAFTRGEVRTGDGDVADVAAGQPEGMGEEVEVDVVLLRQLRAQVLLPEAPAVLVLRHREVDDGVEAAGEGLVDVGPQVG